jgi:hypothetical protein
VRDKQKTYESVGVVKDPKVKAEGVTHLPYTRWCGGLEHLKIETRLIDEKFVICSVTLLKPFFFYGFNTHF